MRREYQQVVFWERLSSTAFSPPTWTKTPWFVYPQEMSSDPSTSTGIGRRKVAKITSLKDSQVVAYV